MEQSGILDGTGEVMAGHRVLEGTDLEIAYNLAGDSLVIRVNKGAWQVFRVVLREAVPPIDDMELLHFNRVSPDFTFTAGDTKGRMLALARAVGLDRRGAGVRPWRKTRALPPIWCTRIASTRSIATCSRIASCEKRARRD